MKLNVLQNKKDLLEFELMDERHSLPNILQAVLSKMKETDFVSYKLEHPMDEKAVFILRSTKQTPVKLLSKACDQLINDLNDFEKQVKKSVK